MGYKVFSDESGTWNSSEYYVRSWIKMDSDEYLQLKKEVIYSKYETSVKELKYEKYRSNRNKFENIFSVNCSIFITISVPQHFVNRPYTILETLENIPVSQSTGGESLTEAIKRKIISSTKNTLFFNYFESQHIWNSKAALIGTDSPQLYEYIIDAPQCLSKEWEEIANECGIQNVKVVKKSEEYPGIELADVVAGCISKMIQEDEIAKQIYKDHIKNKMTDMTSQDCPNPNLIFFGNFTDDQKTKLRIFR